MKKKDFLTTKKITYVGIFVALSVAINTLRIGSVSFGGFPIIFSGYILGPGLGFVVGGLADVVGFLIRPSSTGAFNPLFALTSALTGAIPVIVTRGLGDKYPNLNLWKVLIGVLVGQTITSVIIVPFAISILYGKNTFWYYMTSAAIKQVVSIPIYSILIISINKVLSKQYSFN